MSRTLQTFEQARGKDRWTFSGIGRRRFTTITTSRKYGYQRLDLDRPKPTVEAPRAPGEPEE
jgi:hypothetical protein